MVTGGLTGLVYKLSNWLMKLAFLNILWILFSLLGLLILGLSPATIAMFAVIRKLGKDPDEPVFKSFLKVYKKEFFKGNIMGIILIMIGLISYFDIQFFKESSHPFLQLFYFPFVFLNCIFYLTVMYIFPTYVHYNASIFQVIKNAFLIMVMNPLSSFYMITGVIIVYLGIIYIPAIIPFYSVSIFALIIMVSATRAFQKTEQKKSAMESENASI
ncbi:hypothetical protein CJ195_10380 [Bacillus sp. UMB0899]|nr:hypothetical protein CJ195_10380 [Bacillus sp. UMB0899]